MCGILPPSTRPLSPGFNRIVRRNSAALRKAHHQCYLWTLRCELICGMVDDEKKTA